MPESLGLAVGVIAAITVTFGNLAAFGQTNLKRLLAYSTIAHAGYMLLAVAVVTPAGAAARALLPRRVHRHEPRGVRGRRVRAERDRLRRRSTAFRGLVRRQPVLAVMMTIFLLSLLGLPPLAGFAGKFQVFVAVYDAARAATAAGHANLGTAFYVLLGDRRGEHRRERVLLPQGRPRDAPGGAGREPPACRPIARSGLLPHAARRVLFAAASCGTHDRRRRGSSRSGESPGRAAGFPWNHASVTRAFRREQCR